MEELNLKKTGELYTIGKLIQDSLVVIRRDFKILLEIALLFIVSTLTFYFFSGGGKGLFFTAFDRDNFGQSVGCVLLSFLPVLFLYILGIAQIIAINALSDNRPVTIGESFKAALERLSPAYWWVVPFWFLVIWFYFYPYAVIIEGEEGFFACRRSKQLVQGHGWYVFAVIFITLIIFIAVAGFTTGILWEISHLIAKTPLTADSFFFFYLVTFPIVGIPAIASQILLYKNLIKIKDEKIPFFEHIHLSEGQYYQNNNETRDKR